MTNPPTDTLAAVRAKVAQRASELAMDRIWSTFEWEQDPTDATWMELSEGIYDDVIAALEADTALAALGAEREGLKEALADVVNPIRVLERQAQAEGARLSGQTYAIANDLGFVQQIARRALAGSSVQGAGEPEEISGHGMGSEWTPPPAQPREVDELVKEATFLLTRIGELDWSDFDALERDWNGHVYSSLSRLRKALEQRSARRVGEG